MISTPFEAPENKTRYSNIIAIQDRQQRRRTYRLAIVSCPATPEFPIYRTFLALRNDYLRMPTRLANVKMLQARTQAAAQVPGQVEPDLVVVRAGLVLPGLEALH
jgi:hypothetical protein